MPFRDSPLEKFLSTVYNILDVPVTAFREKIVVPNQQKYPWYHQQFRRVPTIAECNVDDNVCIFEAQTQFSRDKLVDKEILNILKNRYGDCTNFEYPDLEKCKPLYDMYYDALDNWFIKYGDLGYNNSVIHAFMKQKHRMIWERRHGPVGTGMRE
ncbi:NADH dehydrogenase [ubiquinone] 1 beta subcomplex subunit 10 [Orussus abietinus]|uniref:NADH dehydrogenase [ubiquinone] 1 beta subcomplex subunit 10 n=1 Tax=Orussus abietinus TaxID=222816 RepID=UPI00062633A1|nr:NADH dehydrogenase [ubiquinone] 1 beta subcomplex subunit 10 [Orussus abietinus]